VIGWVGGARGVGFERGDQVVLGCLPRVSLKRYDEILRHSGSECCNTWLQGCN
jgi:hypothetical protein